MDAPTTTKQRVPVACIRYPFINRDTINAIDMSRIKKKMTPTWSNNERLGGCSL